MKKEVILKIIGIVIGLTALADTQFELLQSIGLSNVMIGYIKLFGLILALILPSVSDLKFLSKDEEPIPEDGIGGGGIKNPK